MFKRDNFQLHPLLIITCGITLWHNKMPSCNTLSAADAFFTTPLLFANNHLQASLEFYDLYLSSYIKSLHATLYTS